MNVGPLSQLALGQIKLSTAMVKQQAQAEQQLVSLITEAVQTGKVTASRGNNINISA